MTTTALSRPLSLDELDRFGAEIDELQRRTAASLGERDARYIRRVARAVRYCEAAGRALLFASVFPPCWILGTLLLGLSKILENMELGHNVMHGQYDWMGDPAFNGKTYEWSIAGTADAWRRTHNFKHHTYTNVRGMDDDIGYGLLRLFPEQRWRPFALLQPLYALLFGLLFQWGVAIQELELGKVFKGRKRWRVLREQARPLGRKVRRMLVMDYVIFPLLAGPFFLYVIAGNFVANGMRNLWTFTIIFCGHFTANAQVFSRESINGESRGHWCLRQLHGSSNLSGGRLLHLLSGNLSHQIEHHLFPTLPACRYAELAPQVQEICRRYGQHYNTGSLPRQFGQVLWRIFRYAFPSPQPRARRLAVA
jgi:fatty acid desaturase